MNSSVVNYLIDKFNVDLSSITKVGDTYFVRMNGQDVDVGTENFLLNFC